MAGKLCQRRETSRDDFCWGEYLRPEFSLTSHSGRRGNDRGPPSFGKMAFGCFLGGGAGGNEATPWQESKFLV